MNPARSPKGSPTSRIHRYDAGESGWDIIYRLRESGRPKATTSQEVVTFAPPGSLRTVYGVRFSGCALGWPQHLLCPAQGATPRPDITEQATRNGVRFSGCALHWPQHLLCPVQCATPRPYITEQSHSSGLPSKATRTTHTRPWRGTPHPTTLIDPSIPKGLEGER